MDREFFRTIDDIDPIKPPGAINSKSYGDVLLKHGTSERFPAMDDTNETELPEQGNAYGTCQMLLRRVPSINVERKKLHIDFDFIARFGRNKHTAQYIVLHLRWA